MPAFLLPLLLLLLPRPAHPSIWDPHPFPSTPPYVEGWYLRLTGLDTPDTIALIFGASLLPANSTLPPVYLALLHGRSPTQPKSTHPPNPRTQLPNPPTNKTGDSTTNTTHVYEGLPPSSAVHITGAGGQPITSPPSWSTPPNFTWTVSPSSSSSSSSSPSLSFTHDGAHLHLLLLLPSTQERGGGGGGGGGRGPSVRFEATVECVEWVDDGSYPHPHSWTDVIDGVPLHW